MSVFGIDFGTLNSTVAITRQGGVDIVTNEVSKRETTTMVTFVEEERFIGEQALDRYVRNAKNTAFQLKRLIGMRMSDPQLAHERKFITCALQGDAQDRLMMGVQYAGEMKWFYPEQVLAMVFQKLKSYVNEAATVDPKKPADVRDCVITVPVYYTAEQRRLMYQAAETAGLHCMTIVNESTAVAVDYGIFRGSNLKETEAEAQMVGILDIGYSSTTFSIYKFWRGNCRSVGQAFDRNCGTRDVDYQLYTEMVKEVKAKYKVDVSENQRASLRVLQACERVKYLLSANQSAPLNVENVMDIDINIPSFERATLEGLCTGVVDRVRSVLQRALDAAGVDGSQLHSIEMIGGGCRIPMFKALVESVLGGSGRVPSFTLNASESIVRGCAVLAAVYSPMFQVRDFKVLETPAYPIQLGYYVETTNHPTTVPFLPDVNKVVKLLTEKDVFPKILDVTIPRGGIMKLYAFYDFHNETVKHEVQPKDYLIGEWEVSVPKEKHDVKEVKVRLDLGTDGLVTLESARAIAHVEVEEAAPAPADGAAPAEGEKEKVKKRKQKYYDAAVRPNVSLLGHDGSLVLQFKKDEAEMYARDYKITLTREKKNELESYILDYRPRLSEGGMLADYATAADRANFLQQCDADEQWLYEDGEAAEMEAYEQRIQALRAVGDAAHRRFKVRDDVEFAITKFNTKMDQAKEIALGKIGKQAHITEEELRKAAATADEAKAWAAAELAKLMALPKTEDGQFTTKDLDRKAEEVTIGIRTVANRPAPKPPAAPPAAPKPAEQPAPAQAEPQPAGPDSTAEAAPEAAPQTEVQPDAGLD
eukprot:gene1809-1097_t